jgi:hypothetical protein
MEHMFGQERNLAVPGVGDKAYSDKIVVALQETTRLMEEIDEIIEAHGGWPIE